MTASKSPTSTVRGPGETKGVGKRGVVGWKELAGPLVMAARMWR